MSQSTIHPPLSTPRLTIHFFDPSRPSDYTDLLSVYTAIRAVKDIGARDCRTPADIDERTAGKGVPASLLPKSKYPPPTHVWTLVYLKSESPNPSSSTAAASAAGETSSHEQSATEDSGLTIVGHASVFCLSPDDGAKVGYALKPEFWGRGIATEAVREVLRYYSEDLGLERIGATASLDNMASVRVLMKTGGREIAGTEGMATYVWDFGGPGKQPLGG